MRRFQNQWPLHSPGFRGTLIVFAGLTQVQAQTENFGAFPNNSTHSAAAVAQAIANVPANVGQVYDANGQTNDIQIWNFNTLYYTGSYNIATTLTRIRDGYWMPTETDDGGFFNFESNELPNIPREGNNYYMEFVVWPSMDFAAGTYDESVEPFPGIAFPGAMRLLIGLGGQVYFTGDHYGEDGAQTNAYYVNPITSLPTLKLSMASTNHVLLTWAAPSTGFSLQQTTNLASGNWTTVTNQPGVTNSLNQVVLPAPASNAVFFTLQYQ